jgi:nuclear pore complex protein Nup205
MINLNVYEEDDTLMDKSLEQRVFNFLRKSIVQNVKFHKEKYFVERIHNLITDFIYKMPEKIKDMRNKNEELVADEVYNQASSNYINSYLQSCNSQQTINPRIHNTNHEITNHEFEDFLNLIGDIYRTDPLKLELNLNYWIADSELNTGATISYQKPTHKQVI